MATKKTDQPGIQIPAEAEQKTETVKLVFVYIKLDQKGKKSCWYYHLTDEPNDGSRLPFSEASPKAKVYSPKKPWLYGLESGAIISIDRVIKEDEPDGFTVFGDTARMAGQWKCEDQVSEWQMIRRAESLAREASKDNKAFDFSSLDWVRRRYRRMTGRKQKAFVVNLLHWLDKPPGLFEKKDEDD
jgi:hypothetical protein